MHQLLRKLGERVRIPVLLKPSLDVKGDRNSMEKALQECNYKLKIYNQRKDSLQRKLAKFCDAETAEMAKQLAKLKQENGTKLKWVLA